MRSLWSFRSNIALFDLLHARNKMVFEIIIETIILQETCNFLESTIVYFFKVKTLKYILIKLMKKEKKKEKKYL